MLRTLTRSTHPTFQRNLLCSLFDMFFFKFFMYSFQSFLRFLFYLWIFKIIKVSVMQLLVWSMFNATFIQLSVMAADVNSICNIAIYYSCRVHTAQCRYRYYLLTSFSARISSCCKRIYLPIWIWIYYFKTLVQRHYWRQ